MPISPYTSTVDGKPVWNDLNLTNYPWYLDNRQSVSDEGNIDPNTGNPQFKLNVNFDERTRTTQAKDYFVLAEDVNAIQDAIIAIQRTMGKVPYGTRGADDVAARLDFLEGFVVMNRSIDIDGFDNLDKRLMWGGNWPVNPDTAAPANPISIKTHRHTGDYQGAQKIDLALEVTNKLSKLNLELGNGTVNMLTASDIYVSTAKTDTISSALDKKYDKTGGTISGDVTIAGNFRCLTMAELDVASMSQGSTGTNISDNKAYSGYARTALSTNPSGLLAVTTIPLRYGKYVAGIRMKVASNISPTPVVKITITEGGVTEVADTLSPNIFKTNDYEMFYIEFDHMNRSGLIGRRPAQITLNFYTGITTVSIDSIIIQPVTTAVYDDDSFLI